MSRVTSTPNRSMPTGSSVEGATTRTRAPSALSRMMFERATRECKMSPQMATVSRSMRPLLRRMVSASSSAWVGCSCEPSPALITEQSTLRASSSTAPEAWCRTTMISGRMALRVIAVSISVSPLRMEDEPTDMFMTSAPSRLPASSNEAWVRVETSKNRLINVRPRNELCFFSIWRLSATNSSARSSRPKISAGESPSIPNRCRWLRTNVDLWAMFIKAGSIGSAAASRKDCEPADQRRLWMFLKRRRLPAGRPTGPVGLAAWSLDLDARVPHHFAPLVNIGLDLDGKLLRCAAHRRKAERREPLLDVRQPDDPHQLAGEEIHHRPGRRGRCDEADDQFGFLVVEAAFGHGRNVGDDRRSLRTGHRQGADRTLLDVRGRGRQPDIGHERMAGDGRGEDGRRTGKGHPDDRQVQPETKKLLAGEQVLAETHGREAVARGIGPRERDELLQGFRRHGRMDRDHRRRR